MNRHRLIVELSALVLSEPNTGARRATLAGRYRENTSSALETLIGVEFVAQELGRAALRRLAHRHRAEWLADLHARETAVLDYSTDIVRRRMRQAPR